MQRRVRPRPQLVQRVSALLEAVWRTGDDGVVNAEASLRARWPSLFAAAKRVLSIFAFALLPIVLLSAFTLGVIGNHFAFDFHTF